MDALNKLKSLYSINILAISGWLGVFSFLISTCKYFLQPKGGSADVIGLIFLLVCGFLCGALILTIIAYLLEKSFNWQIVNQFILHNKFWTFFIILGLLFFISPIAFLIISIFA